MRRTEGSVLGRGAQCCRRLGRVDPCSGKTKSVNGGNACAGAHGRTDGKGRPRGTISTTHYTSTVTASTDFISREMERPYAEIYVQF